MRKYFFATITVSVSDIETVERFLFVVVGRAIKTLVKKFSQGFYGGKIDSGTGMYVFDDDYGNEISYTPADCTEITEAEYNTMVKYLPSHVLE